MHSGDGSFFGDASAYGGGTAATPKGKAERGSTAQHVLPVTTRQIRNSSESGVMIGGNVYNLITFVGRVIQIDQSSLMINYTIEDDRGTIEAVHWIDQNGDTDRLSVAENVYCRVYGSVKSKEDRKFVMVFKITPLKTLNELTSHRMEVAVVAKRLEMAAAKAIGTGTSNDGMNGGGLDSSLMNMSKDKVALSGVRQQVFEVIKRFTDPGVHVDEINTYLTEKISQAEINKVCEDLMNEGHIYSSVDEHHFLPTEG